MSIHVMPGVDFRACQPQAVFAIAVASEVCKEIGKDCLVTSVYRPGLFSEHGFHALGRAVDIAVRELSGLPWSQADGDYVVEHLHRRLGKRDGGQFDVVDERRAGASPGWTGAHIHIEYDPQER